jgi:hypothetical protein
MATLSELHIDHGAIQQAAMLVDAMDSGTSGNITNINTAKAMRRGWTCQGNDFVSYDELDVLQWSQGCISLIEKEDNPEVVRAMLLTLRNMLRDAQFHSFEAARLCVIS